MSRIDAAARRREEAQFWQAWQVWHLINIQLRRQDRIKSPRELLGWDTAAKVPVSTGNRRQRAARKREEMKRWKLLRPDLDWSGYESRKRRRRA